MAGRLNGKTAVVTGAGRGIGAAIAKGIAAQGAQVVVADWGGAFDGTGAGSTEPADEVVAEIRDAGGSAVAAYNDIATMDGARRTIEAALTEFGRLDALVCCAGIARQRELWEFAESDWDDVIRVHLKGHFACTRAAIPHMIAQGSGRLVYFSSSAAISGPPLGASYGAAKAGVLGFTWSASKALRRHGITVNAIMPGAHTRLVDNLSGDWGVLPGRPEPTSQEREHADNPDELEALRALRREPANVAPAVVYLVSDEAAGITGQFFAVSGYQITRFELPQPAQTIRSDGPWDIDQLFERFPRAFGADLSLEPLRWPS